MRSKLARSASRASSSSPAGSAAWGTRNHPNRTGRAASATAARPDPDEPEGHGHVDQDELAGGVGGDGERRLGGHLGGVAGADRLAAEPGPAVDQVDVGAAAGPDRVLDLVARGQ